MSFFPLSLFPLSSLPFLLPCPFPCSCCWHFSFSGCLGVSDDPPSPQEPALLSGSVFLYPQCLMLISPSTIQRGTRVWKGTTETVRGDLAQDREVRGSVRKGSGMACTETVNPFSSTPCAPLSGVGRGREQQYPLLVCIFIPSEKILILRAYYCLNFKDIHSSWVHTQFLDWCSYTTNVLQKWAMIYSL